MYPLEKLFKPNLLLPTIRNNVPYRNIAWFEKIPPAPPDPVFGLVEDFKKDTAKTKVNLAIGSYRDDNDKPFILGCVQKAEKTILERKMNKEYAGITGIARFCELAMNFTFGEDSIWAKTGRHVTLQVLSGAGGLSMAAQLLRKYFPGVKVVYISDPTWANHHNIFNWMGIKTDSYRYYDAKNLKLDFEGMMQDIECMPKKSVILLHASGHNPTGFDPDNGQWQEIAKKIKEREIYTIVDNAYQGFASGDIDRDACGFRILAKEGINICLATSFAKNLGLYGERIGALTFLVDNVEEGKKIRSNLIPLIRANYSNPPLHGARIVIEIFEDKKLTKMWKKEMKIMANRIRGVRKALVEGLKKAGSKRNWDYIQQQNGMFSFTGLTVEQIQRLKKEFHIYASKSGRIAVVGINSKNLDYIVNAFHKVTS